MRKSCRADVKWKFGRGEVRPDEVSFAMKRAALGLTLVALVVVELYLATAYLPLRYQITMGSVVNRALLRQGQSR